MKRQANKLTLARRSAPLRVLGYIDAAYFVANWQELENLGYIVDLQIQAC